MDLSLKELMLIQGALEILLLLVLLVLLWRTWNRGKVPDPTTMPEELQKGIERFLSESEKIAATFAANLKDKKDLTSDLILKLDRRLADYRALLGKTETAFDVAEKKLKAITTSDRETKVAVDNGKANPAAPEVRAMVLQMAKKGLSVEDIAIRSRLHRGEVELIIELEHQFSV